MTTPYIVQGNCVFSSNVNSVLLDLTAPSVCTRRCCPAIEGATLGYDIQTFALYQEIHLLGL
jgi:hypothetical protein